MFGACIAPNSAALTPIRSPFGACVARNIDGTTRPMALTIAVASLGAFASFRIAQRERTPVSR